MRSFGSELYESVRRTHSAALAMLGIIIALAQFWISPSSTVETRWAIVAGTIVLVAVTVLFDLALRMFNRTQLPLPTVRAVHVSKGGVAEEVLLLLTPSEMFGYEVAVSIYTRIDEFEVLIGVGRVMTIQQDGAIQVKVTKRIPSYDSAWTPILAHDKRAHSALVIKPSVPLDSLLFEETS